MAVFVDSPALLSLHAEFLNFVEKAKIEVISFAETKPTHISSLHLQLKFVPTESASEYISLLNVCTLTFTFLHLSDLRYIFIFQILALVSSLKYLKIISISANQAVGKLSGLFSVYVLNPLLVR